MDCFDILKQQSSYFLKHTYIKRMQSRAFISERESLKDDDSTVVIQVDFAENYTTQIQNAIQSSYWVSKQFTLFTVCAWEKMVAIQLSLLQTIFLITKMQCKHSCLYWLITLNISGNLTDMLFFRMVLQLSSNKNSLCVE